MTDALEAPRSDQELYLARGEEVSLLRPVMTGDVFVGVSIPGVEHFEGDDEQLAMVVTHPCSMRKGVPLKSHQQAIRVVRTSAVELSGWTKHFDRIPLPNLKIAIQQESDLPDVEAVGYSGLFELRGRVPTKALDVHRRLCCLSEEGVAFLHQRMCHADTRFAPRVRDLMEACAGVFAEAELEQEWKEQLIDPAVLVDAAKLWSAIENESMSFDAVMAEERAYPVGKKLKDRRIVKISAISKSGLMLVEKFGKLSANASNCTKGRRLARSAPTGTITLCTTAAVC